jgi:hypothetical protein
VGAQAAGTGDGGQVIVEGAPVSTGREQFRDRYISARDFQAEGLGEEMLEIVRDTSGDDLARARLRALERQAARMAPRKYGIRP